MREIYRVVIGCLIGTLIASPAHAGSNDTDTVPFQDGHSKNVLRAMDRASTWGHPDQAGEFQGILHFAKGDYVGAMKYFLDGALYADKLSQLCIGLMYLNGEGVQKDPVTAYAWIAIAAERKYPKFVMTRDQLWAQLNSDQRKQATVLVEKLAAQYGDAVAKPRMSAQLMQNALQGTASKLGYDDGRIGRLQMNPGLLYSWNDPASCDINAIGGAPVAGCNNGLAGAPLKPNDYFRARDSQWQGNVTVGPMQKANAPQKTATTHDQHGW